MSEEEFKKIVEKTMAEQIMKNLDSSLIFTYIRNLEEDLKKDKEKNKALETEYLIQRDLINADFLKDYIHKDKIKKLLETYDKNIAWANADDHYYFVKFINEILDE